MKEKWNLANSGFDYNVVAVFGSQSTGKSKYHYLLFNIIIIRVFFFFFFFFYFILYF